MNRVSSISEGKEGTFLVHSGGRQNLASGESDLVEMQDDARSRRRG